MKNLQIHSELTVCLLWNNWGGEGEHKANDSSKYKELYYNYTAI